MLDLIMLDKQLQHTYSLWLYETPNQIIHTGKAGANNIVLDVKRQLTNQNAGFYP